MYNTILVPLDGSKRAEKILNHVEALAHCFRSKVIFLQVVIAPRITGIEKSDIVLFGQETEQRIKDAESYLTSLKGGFLEKGIESQVRVVHGPVAWAIINSAEREGADLIAITSHGRSGLSRVYYGSVAAGILNHVDKPLLITRTRGDK